jgi:GT2 family glycosyltransferase/protoporphyrinogen oxidase
MYTILGAGIAGLTTAYVLREYGIRAMVLERSDSYGGLARSFQWGGMTCDFAAHRLFTHDQQVLNTIQSLVPMHHHHRRSQIYFNGAWMNDPIDLLQLIQRLPPNESAQLIQSYVQRDRSMPETSFEAFVVRRYGDYLYHLFFRPYTERLFTLPGDEVDVEWARRKVRLASPLDRLRQGTKTKFASFYYPVRGGYGAIADALYRVVADQVIFNAEVTELERDEQGQIVAVWYDRQGEGQCRMETSHVISTLPMTVNARLLGIDLSLDYQKVDAVYLLLNKPTMTNNHWLYFMDDQSVINRLVEFKHMSAVDTPPDQTVVCAEVTKDIAQPIEGVIDNLVQCGVISPADVADASVRHEPFSYPRYRLGYPSLLQAFHTHPDQPPNIHYLGRAAQFEHLEVDDLIGTIHRYLSQLVAMQEQPVTQESKVQDNLVWIVVLAWNNYEDTAECLASLTKTAYAHYRIVLVDNGSTDGTPDRVRATFPDVDVVENGANLGVPTGYNVGFRYALRHGADYVLMLNNDTTVDPTMVAHLVEAARKNPDAGILSPIFYYYDHPQDVWASGARYRRFPPAIIPEMRVFPITHAGKYYELEYAISCGLLITRRAFEMVGLFDENFLFLWDDYDFSERVRRSGLQILQVPDAKMWHKISRTTQAGSPLYWQVHGESGAIFYRRHSSKNPLAMAMHLGYFAVREFAWNRRWWTFLKPYLRGLRQGFTRQLKDVPQVKGLSYPG